jgi:imidazolonepropionase-like amidohydrolase
MINRAGVSHPNRKSPRSARLRATLLKVLSMALASVIATSAAAETIVLRADHMIDPATKTIGGRVAVLIVDGRIAKVGDDNLAAPAGARTIDLGNAWLMPGLMDTHTHLAADAIAEHLSDDGDATLALNAYRHGVEMLRGGFTTVRDVGFEGDYAVVGLRRQIERGALLGPTILSAGKQIAPYGGDRDRRSPLPFYAGPTWRRLYIDADTPEEMVKAVRQNLRYGAKVIKLYADIQSYYMSAADVAAAVGEAHRAGVKVAAHVSGGPAADAVIAGGVDSIEHGFNLTREQLLAMKAKGIFLSGTDFDPHSLGRILHDDAKVAQFAPLIQQRLAMADQLGVKLAFGSDVVWPDRDRPRAQIVLDETDTWRAAGIAPMTMLNAMTANAAALLGIADQRGAIRPGLFADLIAMPANPLSDTSALRGICFVMKEGSVVRTCNERPRT